MAQLNLALMRHGQANYLADSDRRRALTAHGQAQVAKQSSLLDSWLQAVDLAIVSDAVRTRETFEHLFGHIKPQSVIIEPRIYDEHDYRALLTIISDLITRHLENLMTTASSNANDPTLGSVIVIGHNPVISSIATFLSGLQYDLGTADCVMLTVEADHWVEGLAMQGCWTMSPQGHQNQ